MADQALIDSLRERISAVEAGGVPSDDTVPRGGNAGFRGGSPRANAPSGTGNGSQDAPATRSTEPYGSNADEALRKIVALVNVSDRSERTVRERLARAKFPSNAIDEAVNRAKSYGFIDDARFAATLVRSRLSQAKGVPGIERELRSHGIELDMVPGWPDEFEADEKSELDRALGLLEKKPPRSKNLRDAAYRKLVSKGYSSSIASTAARLWFDSRQ